MGVGRRDWIGETMARPERRMGISVRFEVWIVRGVKGAPMGVSSWEGGLVSMCLSGVVGG